MQELERMIEIYHTAFVISLVLSCVFLAVAILLFFKFDIRTIIDMKTGRGAKRAIQKMEELNAKTGKLREDMVVATPSALKPEERIVYPATAETSRGQDGMGRTAGQQAASDGSMAAPMSRTEDRTQEEGTQETEVLYPGTPGETTLLYAGAPMQTQRPKIELPGLFKIEKEVMWVHTEVLL